MAKNRLWLLDTNVFLWWMQDDDRLGKVIRSQIDDYHRDVWVSVVSVWEVLIKKKIGKLKVPLGIKEDLRKAGLGVLPLELDQVLAVDRLPLFHRDPFDRMLVAQAQTEGLTLITADKQLGKYEVKLLLV